LEENDMQTDTTTTTTNPSNGSAEPRVLAPRAAKPTYAELQARLQAAEEALTNANRLSFKLSEKGAVSVYGLGRFPTTLYYEQWMRLLDEGNLTALRQFLSANKDRCTMKART
jgi:hypothetical protein